MSGGWWLFFVFLALLVHGFSAMFEMAVVSINRLRLSYEIAQGSRRAARMAQLLEQPLQLFGALLLLLNVALVVGSECSRRMYDAWGLDPDLSALTQVVLVIVVGELAPMFAARRHPEQVARATVDLVYWISRLLLPITWLLDWVARLAGRLFGATRSVQVFALTRDELERLWEEPEGGISQDASQAVAANILGLRQRVARDAMIFLEELPHLDANATVGQVRQALRASRISWLPLRQGHTVVALATPRALLRLNDTQRARDAVRPSWFISEETSLSELLHQLRSNRQSAGVVLNSAGRAVGVVTLDSILEMIFNPFGAQPTAQPSLLVDRLIPGSMPLAQLAGELTLPIKPDSAISVAQWMVQQLGHRPDAGELVRLGDFQLIVQEVTVLGIKTVRIHSLHQ
jgi:putative hemolysin